MPIIQNDSYWLVTLEHASLFSFIGNFIIPIGVHIVQRAAIPSIFGYSISMYLLTSKSPTACVFPAPAFDTAPATCSGGQHVQSALLGVGLLHVPLRDAVGRRRSDRLLAGGVLRGRGFF